MNNEVLVLLLDYIIDFVCMCVLREGGARGKCTCMLVDTHVHSWRSEEALLGPALSSSTLFFCDGISH